MPSDPPQTTEMTREHLLRIARIIGPSSAAAAALADMDRIGADGDHSLCVRQGSRLVVIRAEAQRAGR